MYTCSIYGILDLDPFASLDYVIQGLSRLMHFALTNAEPHKIAGIVRNVVIQRDPIKVLSNHLVPMFYVKFGLYKHV